MTLCDESGSVLVVDDDVSIRRMIARMLERAGYQCSEAPDAPSALALAAHDDFQLVTCDINMPGGSGLGLVRDLQAGYPDIAVLMVSGMDSPATAAAAAELGAYGFVVKPFAANEMVIAVSNALRRRHLEIENRSYRRHLESLVSERTADLTATVERLRTTEQALKETQEEAIRNLAFAAEFNDPTTGAHIGRISRTCEVIANRSGLDDSDQAELIRIAAPMHDIGKIGVPQEILRKPGKLTPEETNEMRRHPVIGHEILGRSSSDLLATGALIALSHHERWDGNGYPNRLTGTEIPIEGRIVAIADVFDALTSERPYKPAFSVDHAVSIMTEERERHFDPELLDVFLSVLDEITDLVASPG